MPAQGKKTPRMMRRDKRRRRAVGVKGLEEEEEEKRRDNNGFGPENGLWIGLWCKKNADIFCEITRRGISWVWKGIYWEIFDDRIRVLPSPGGRSWEMTMRVCLDFDHLCSIAFFTLITCLRKRGKRDNILIAFIYIYISYYIILYIIKVGLRRSGYARWLHQIEEILLKFWIFKELKINSILPRL